MLSCYGWVVIGSLGWMAGGMSAEVAEAVCLAMPSAVFVAEEGQQANEEKLPEEKPASKAPTKKSASKKAGKTSPEKPDEKEAKGEPDPFQVPDGSPEELLKYIEGLRQLKAKDITTREQLIDFLRKLHQAMLEAADKVLAGKPTEKQQKQAAQAKLQGLIMLVQLGDPTAEDRLEKFIDQLQKEGKKDLARDAQGILFLFQWRNIKGPQEGKKFLDKFVQFIEEDTIGMRELRLMLMIGQELESQLPELAREAYPRFSQIAAKSSLPIGKELVKRWEAVVRRLELPGKPIEIQGITLDGKEFDWEKFRKDKVVLIDFWATWCGWCIREIPELKRLYQAYRDRGFEIVGISGDQKREELEQFLQGTEIPWTILYGKEGPSPTIQYYGVTSWPTMLLVGKDGKVVSLNARGEKLREELQRLLGPIEEKPDSSSPAPTPSPTQNQ